MPRPSRAARTLALGAVAASLVTGVAAVTLASPAGAAPHSALPHSSTHAAAHPAAHAAAGATMAGYRVGAANLDDPMHRRVSPGWGRAAHGGGVYHVSSTGRFAVNGSVATMTAIPSGKAADALLPAASHTNELVQLDFSMPRLPAGGMGETVTIELRLQAGFWETYRAQVRVTPHGRLVVGLSVLHRHVGYGIGNTNLIAQRIRAGQTVHLQGMIVGSGDVLVRSRAWVGHHIPAWQATAHDTSGARIARAGGVGVWSYTSGKTPATSVDVHRLTGWGLHRV